MFGLDFLIESDGVSNTIGWLDSGNHFAILSTQSAELFRVG